MRLKNLFRIVFAAALVANVGSSKVLADPFSTDGITSIAIVAGNIGVSLAADADLPSSTNFQNCSGTADAVYVGTALTLTLSSSDAGTNCVVQVIVPEKVDVELSVAQGVTTISGEFGTLTATISNGDLTVNRLKAITTVLEVANDRVKIINTSTSLKLTGANGRATISNFKGRLTVNRSNGSVTSRRLKLRAGRRNSLNISNGDIDINDIQTTRSNGKTVGLRLTATTINGDIDLNGGFVRSISPTRQVGSLTRSGNRSVRIKLHTTNGNIAVQ